MSKNVSKAGIRFRRVLHKLGKYTMFIITVITCYNITTHLFELRAERIKKEESKRTAIAVISALSWTFGICAVLTGIIKYIKYLKKGYLLDLFDTEDYDVIEPDEENPAESIIRSELYGIEENEEHEKLNCMHIPLDEEACEDDYK
jgi:hypothetical protein